MLIRSITVSIFLFLAIPAVIFGQDPLGDTDSFGTNAKFAGSVTSGNVYLKSNCTTIVLTPNDRCKTINASNFVALGAVDIGNITFPENSFQNVMYLVITNQSNFYLTNTTATNQTGNYRFAPFIYFESPVLSDPALINPQNGQPFGGKILINLPLKKVYRTMVPGAMDVTEETYVTAFTNGISKRFLMETYGLSQVTVDSIFAKKITIRLNVNGSSSQIFDGFVSYSIRFFGN